MLRLIVVFVIYSLSNAHAVFDPTPEEWGEKVWLVHASSHMPTDGYVVAGHGARKDKDRPYLMPTRKTHHHCVGGLVPNTNMRVTFNLLGVRVGMNLPDGHARTSYVFIEPWRAFHHQLVGGLACDTFIFGGHTYGQEAVFFIPEQDRNEFRVKNNNFLGSVVFYDPQTTTTRALVEEHLREKKAWQILHGDMDAPVQLIRHDSSDSTRENLTQEQLRVLYAKMSCVLMNHNRSPFAILENVLIKFEHVFFGIATQHKNLSTLFMNADDRRLLSSIVRVLLDQIEDKLALIQAFVREEFKSWRQDIFDFLSLYEQLHEAFLQGKFLLDYAFLKNLVLNRHDPSKVRDELAALANGSPLRVQPNPLCFGERKVGLPDYWSQLSLLNQQDKIILLSRLSLTEGLRKAVSAYFALLTLFATKDYLDKDIEHKNLEVLDAVNKSSSPHDGSNKISKESLRPSDIDTLFKYKLVEEDLALNEAAFLARLNAPPVRESLAQVYGLPELLARPLVLMDVLKIHPRTRTLFAENVEIDDQILLHYELFMRPYYLNKEYGSFKEALEAVEEFNSFKSQLIALPIDPSEPAYASGQIQYDKTIYGFMKQGRFGSLSDIFRHYGCEQCFRETFPTDEDFWSQKEDLMNNTTFYNVLSQMLATKSRDFLIINNKKNK